MTTLRTAPRMSIAVVAFKTHSPGKLIVPASVPSKLHIPVALPPAFRLHVTVTRTGGTGPFIIGVNQEGRKFYLLIDAWRKTGDVRVPSAVTFSTLACVRTPPRWQPSGKATLRKSFPSTPEMP